jgi:hypothetical protein
VVLFQYNIFFSTYSYKNLMSLELTDTDIRPKFNLKPNTKGINFIFMTLTENIINYFY